ncbi:hypothetical protein BS78_K130600 [Paspalum vaginatum]|uniref:Endonuclease/exonuclease/phosphatase domain-containing protein n=1 Tax=Paspalum vaginatum TaxID=158149 RepID=A0A9W7XC75_9POAL|nr:hypothetical protein BS78_K130600 [Paspalum vaginatum]
MVSKAQRRVIHSLGFFGETEKIDAAAQDQYSKLFDSVISETHLCALAAIFGWAVEDGLEAWATDLVCLQETKVAAISQFFLCSVFGSDFDKFVLLPTVGTRGGIIIAWKSADVMEEEGRNWWLTGVYGPQGDNDKITFLQELRDVRALCAGPWVIADDFNLIYQAANKNNNNLNRAMMGRFRCFLDNLELKEITLLGRKFTWSNERDNPTLVRLDRAFCSVEWEDIFLDDVLQSATAGVSDHCPLLLGLQVCTKGKRRFHFESF